MGGGNNHQALADNHSDGSINSVQSSYKVIQYNSSSLTRIDLDKKTKQQKTDTELRMAVAYTIGFQTNIKYNKYMFTGQHC